MRKIAWVGMVVACVQFNSFGQQPDQEIDAPLPPLEAASSAIVPAGFTVTLLAGEPDVMQPIGFCLDDRARLWVAEVDEDTVAEVDEKVDEDKWTRTQHLDAG